MGNQILAILSKALQAVGAWYTEVLDSSGTIGIYLAMVACLFAVRFLLTPVFGGSAGSDKATTKRKDKTDG